MSSLGPGDDNLHHCDGSHRYAGAPRGMSLAAWQALVRSHQLQHLATMGGVTAPVAVEELRPPTRAERRAARWIARRAAIERAHEL